MLPHIEAWKRIIGRDFVYPTPMLDELKIYQAVLAAQGVAADPILGIFSGGLIEPARMLLLPHGIAKLGRWVTQSDWKFKGWLPKFEDVAKPLTFYTHTTNGARDEYSLKYLDQQGKERKAMLLDEMDGPLTQTAIWSLLTPFQEGLVLEKSATITISERILKQSSDRRQLGQISGTLVALGPRVSQSGEKVDVDWGPNLALIPLQMTDWEKTLNRLWRDAAEKFDRVGSIVEFINPGLALVGGILSALRPDERIELQEPLLLPTGQDFLVKDQRFFGPLDDGPGVDRQWEWKRGSNDRQRYVFQNFWLYRCLLWANNNLTLGAPSTA